MKFRVVGDYMEVLVSGEWARWNPKVHGYPSLYGDSPPKKTTIDSAQKEIALILKQLEIDIDEVVDNVELYYAHDKQQVRRRVLVNTRPLPGQMWG